MTKKQIDTIYQINIETTNDEYGVAFVSGATMSPLAVDKRLRGNEINRDAITILLSNGLQLQKHSKSVFFAGVDSMCFEATGENQYVAYRSTKASAEKLVKQLLDSAGNWVGSKLNVMYPLFSESATRVNRVNIYKTMTIESVEKKEVTIKRGMTSQQAHEEIKVANGSDELEAIEEKIKRLTARKNEIEMLLLND